MTKREVLYTLLTKDWQLKRIEEDRQNHKIYKFRKNDHYCSIYIIGVFIGSSDLKVKPYNNPIILDLDTITKKTIKKSIKKH